MYYFSRSKSKTRKALRGYQNTVNKRIVATDCFMTGKICRNIANPLIPNPTAEHTAIQSLKSFTYKYTTLKFVDEADQKIFPEDY